ncbi:hypothetical protein ADU60_16310 (plasmid) [Vibrio coralliilyticus]|nr:hypothetical protein ADU60_16310 [Vibrio coralliilyticus]
MAAERLDIRLNEEIKAKVEKASALLGHRPTSVASSELGTRVREHSKPKHDLAHLIVVSQS